MEIIIVSKSDCSECERIKTAMETKGMEYKEENIEELAPDVQFQYRNIARAHRQMAMPLMFVDGKFVRTTRFESEFLSKEGQA